MTFRLEDGVPVPPLAKARRPSGRKPKYPLADMVPSQSFLVPAIGEDEKNRVTRCITYSACALRKREGFAGWKFWTRHVDEGVRVWRIE